MGEIARALALADSAIAGNAADLFVRTLRAWHFVAAGDADAALAVSGPGVAAIGVDDSSADVADLLIVHGAAWRLLGQVTTALSFIDRTLALVPGHGDGLLERARALQRGGLLAAASTAFGAAAKAAPSAAAYAGMAAIASIDGRLAEASAAALQALEIDPAAAGAHLALARVAIAERRVDAASARLRGVLATVIDAETRIEALTLLGDAAVAVDASDAALAAYQDAKQLFGAHWRVRRGAAESHRAVVARLAAGYAGLNLADWPGADPAAAAASHGFLIGFPRSGTTLVETILASLPGVSTLEERATLAAADRAFLADATGLERLVALDEAGAVFLRTDYWQQVTEMGGSCGGGAALFIDMDPLKGLKLPVIARLFPAARIIVMRRDPRDVVWSCFRRNFAPSAAALEFTSLADTARHYAALMDLQDDCLARLPIARHIVRYEALVSDFDRETRALCAFLGRDWSPALRHFGQSEAARQISTISAGQVRKGLYDGSGQWRRHADALAPVLPLLAPFIARYGYAD